MKNRDYWMIDPYSGAGIEPRTFGRRPAPPVERLDAKHDE